MSRLKAFLNPRVPGGVKWWHIHASAATVAVAAIAVSIAFAAGWFSHEHGRDWAQYFRQHDHVFMHAHQGVPPNIPSLPPKPLKTGITLALSGGVHINIVPPVTDQRNTNSCAEQEFAHAMGYDISWALQDGYRRLVSARALYDWINGTANAAAGGNGTSTDQAELAANVHGTIRHRYYDYPTYGSAPFESAPPSYLPVETHTNWLTWLYIAQTPGTTDAGLAAIDTQLASHHVVGVGMDAYDGPTGLFQAGVTGVYDTASLTELKGRHMLTFLSFDKTKTINGVTGWYFAQQSWGTSYGLTINGQPNSGLNGGYLWVSRRLVKQLSFTAVVVHLGIHADVYPPGASRPLVGAPHGPRYVPPSGPTYQAPKITRPVKFGVPEAGAVPQVYGLKTNDTHVDISASINAAAARYGYSAPGYAALMGTESGINQYAPHTPINGAGYCDYSGGLTQITVCTAAGLGVGNGTLSSANIAYVFWYEQQDANRDVALSARLVDEFHRQVCWDWYPLYASWNLGPGYGCYASIYQYPSNPITIQAVSNFRGWLAWVYAYHVRYGPPPKPAGFPARKWRAHIGAISQYDHGKHLRVEAQLWWKGGRVKQAGGIVSYPQYFRRGRHGRGSFMTTRFQGLRLYWWIHHPGWKKWQIVRWIR